jgi:hypothetical protein
MVARRMKYEMITRRILKVVARLAEPPNTFIKG